MRKYIENDKASKAKRKKLENIGTLSKAKAKEFFAKYNNRSGVTIYGTYLDGSVDIGIPADRAVSVKRFFATKVNAA